VANAEVARAVAEWCVSSGRGDAQVGVSSAATTAEALRDFWRVARGMGEAAQRGQLGLSFPHWQEAADPRRFQAVVNHLLACGEVCEWVGESIVVSGRHPASHTTEDEPRPAPHPTLLLRSFVRSGPALWPEADGEDPFAEPPGEGQAEAASGEMIADDATLLAETRAWVEAVICHMKVCPFAGTADRAGLPAGGVSYPITHAGTAEKTYERFWEQVHGLSLTDERERSTVLLITPNFALHSAGGFDAFADTLESALAGLGFESVMQLVFFHPEYTFRDGKQRMGEGDAAAANFARRSPYPMINLLRTPQVRKAQKGIPTGSVYTTNERNLQHMGGSALSAMLEARDWGGVFEKQFASHEENTWK
jgi:hypothetical protein